MPPPSIDLHLYKSEIVASARAKIPHNEILNRLESRHQIKISHPALGRRLQQWQLSQERPICKRRLQFYFY
jgi:hypothetical protein